jgi:hypothetical protein
MKAIVSNFWIAAFIALETGDMQLESADRLGADPETLKAALLEIAADSATTGRRLATLTSRPGSSVAFGAAVRDREGRAAMRPIPHAPATSPRDTPSPQSFCIRRLQNAEAMSVFLKSSPLKRSVSPVVLASA